MVDFIWLVPNSVLSQKSRVDLYYVHIPLQTLNSVLSLVCKKHTLLHTRLKTEYIRREGGLFHHFDSQFWCSLAPSHYEFSHPQWQLCNDEKEALILKTRFDFQRSVSTRHCRWFTPCHVSKPRKVHVELFGSHLMLGIGRLWFLLRCLPWLDTCPVPVIDRIGKCVAICHTADTAALTLI